MPDENDQHDNAADAKRNGKARKNGELHQLRPLEELKAEGEKPKAREPRPPAERTRFWPAPELEHIANTLINEGKAPHMSVLRQARILFLWTNAERVGEDRGQAQRFNAKYGYTEDLAHDFVLTFSQPQLERTPEDLWPAVVYHQLLHLDRDTANRWRIEHHDYEGFLAELEFFREATVQLSEGLTRARQMGLFDNVASAELAEKEPALT